MKKSAWLSDEEQWQAVVRCDRGYDGIFFYGVKTTGIFCRPSCRAKTPVRANVVFFPEAVDALKAGFRPCKRCRPDKAVFAPDLELVRRAQAIYDTNYHQSMEINYLARQLGISTSHLVRLFKQHNGLTPTQYITRLRVDQAAALLTQEKVSIIEIAHMSGFKSLSNFYKCFKRQLGYTPGEYRKGRGDLL